MICGCLGFVLALQLDEGADLETLAREAVARGADCLAMAGGDGSQALVAQVAVEHGLPFAVVSAGTSDLPVAEEAALTAEFFGSPVVKNDFVVGEQQWTPLVVQEGTELNQRIDTRDR